MSIKKAVAVDTGCICDNCYKHICNCDGCHVRFIERETIYCIDHGQEHICEKCPKAYKEEDMQKIVDANEKLIKELKHECDSSN